MSHSHVRHSVKHSTAQHSCNVAPLKLVAKMIDILHLFIECLSMERDRAQRMHGSDLVLNSTAGPAALTS
jgi:hypothetical protein